MYESEEQPKIQKKKQVRLKLCRAPNGLWNIERRVAQTESP